MSKPCCLYSQQKYIDKNGIVNKKDVAKRESDMKLKIDEQLKNSKANEPSIVFVPCTCDCMCHVRGMDVRH
jgi:hypothetical protein